MWIFYTNNGESNAVTRPRVHSMARQTGRSKEKSTRETTTSVQKLQETLQCGKQNGDTRSKPPLRNRIKPAQELEVQQIMDNFNCEYDDVVEAMDLYNLDVEECTTA